MQFINPIEILQLSDVSHSSQIDSSTVKTAKRKLLADIELSDKRIFLYHGIQLYKNDCERAIDDLMNNELKEFYLYLTSYKALNEFLVNGNQSVFENFKYDSIFHLHEFVNFISPYFTPKFDKALLKAFENENVQLLQSILKTAFLASSNNINTAYKGVSNLLQVRLEELLAIKTAIQQDESTYDDYNIHEVVIIVKKAFPTKLINTLPSHFQSQILKIANEINYLNIEIWNNLDNTQASQDLLEHILSFDIDSLNTPTFERNYEIVKRKNLERIEQAKNEPILRKWATILIEIRKYKDEIENNTISSKQAFAKLKDLFSIDELNKLPEYAEDIRIQIGYAIRSLSVSVWNKHNDISSALNIIGLASKINLDAEASVKIQQDLSNLKEMEKKYRHRLICHFCEKDSPDEHSGLDKLIYKEIHRTSFPRRVQFSQTSITLPRCKSCKESHSQINSQYWLYFFGFALAGIIVGAIAKDSYVILGGIIGGFVGWIIGTIIKENSVTRLGIKDDSESTLRSHPLLLERLKDGWTFSKPSA